jgi:hypothetical protein
MVSVKLFFSHSIVGVNAFQMLEILLYKQVLLDYLLVKFLSVLLIKDFSSTRNIIAMRFL